MIAILIVLAVAAVVVTAAVVILFRNNAVYKFRMRLINEMHDFNLAEIDMAYEARVRGDYSVQYPSHWRSREFDSISYYAMVFRPWRALDSFYRESFPEKEEAAT